MNVPGPTGDFSHILPSAVSLPYFNPAVLVLQMEVTALGLENADNRYIEFLIY